MEETLSGLLDPRSYAVTVHAVLSALVGTIFGAYAVYVFARARGSRVGKLFALFATSVAIWLVGFGCVYASSSSHLALRWIKLSYVGVTFIPALGLIFACSVVGRATQLRPITLPALVLSALFLVATYSTDMVIAGTYHYYWGYHPRLGILGACFVLYLVCTFLFVLHLFVSARRSSASERARKRHHGLVIAFFIAPLGAADFLGTFGAPVYPFGYITSAIALFWIGFVNTRYGFRDITPELAAGQILETMQGAVIVVDIEGKIRVANRVAHEMLGRVRAELLGRSLADLIDLPAEIRIPNAGAMPVRDLEMTWSAGDGRRFVVSLSASPLRDHLGSLAGIVYVASDITERKRAAEALRDSEQRFRALVEQAGDGFILMDADGQIIDVNTASCRQLGYSREELLRMKIPDINPNFDAASFRETFQAIAAGGRPRTFETTRRRKDGTQFSAEITVSIVHLGGALWGLALVRDITERRRSEQALRESEERYRATLSSMTDLVFVLDKVGCFVDYHAPRAQELYLPPSIFLGKGLHEVFSPELSERWERAIDVIKAGGPVQQLDYEMDVGGKRSSWSANLGPRRDDTGAYDGATIVARDMTERRLMEDRLHQSAKLTAIGQLAGGIAHDFNNQLTGIMGYGDMLVARLEEGPLKHYAQNILVSARRAADLTQQLLAFGRKGRYLSVPVDLHRLLGEVVAILERSIDKRIRIVQVLRAPHPLTLGDPTQLQNALLNLALNARDAMPQGGDLCFETDVTTPDEQCGAQGSSEMTPGPHIRILVRDTGCGMTDDVKNHLFEPFYTTKGPGEGTGMGLASVYGTVRNHGGAISVESEVGRGTAVQICLPLAFGATLPEAAGTGVEVARYTARILFVDDEPAIREMAVEMLGDVGYSITTCVDGREAIRYYQEHWREIDLVILDMVMPEMNGHDTFVAMRRVNPQVRALLSSGHSLDGAAQAILDEGVTAFIAKPFLRAELLQEVTKALSRDPA